jgi:hypothetical protein
VEKGVRSRGWRLRRDNDLLERSTGIRNLLYLSKAHNYITNTLSVRHAYTRGKICEMNIYIYI